MKKPFKIICENCRYYSQGDCVNCDRISGIRPKKPDDVCDGGGIGARNYGFMPKPWDAYDWDDEL